LKEHAKTALVVLYEGRTSYLEKDRTSSIGDIHEKDYRLQALKFQERYSRFQSNPQEDFDFIELVLANSLNVAGSLKYRVRKISPRTFFSSGQVEHIKEVISSLNPSCVATNAPLSPVHQRNLENEWGVPILTRADVIFEIFEKNATTAEGKLQVELARLHYTLPRIVGIGKELSSPGGDVGTRGGPGEKLTALTKDQIRRRIKILENRIEHSRVTRELRRKKRRKAGLFNVTLIGYTNAGKSSLLNALTKSTVQVDDRYFTTLDPTARTLYVGLGKKVIIKDTVGFLTDLPSELLAAFRATLEEMRETSLFLLVVDASNENVDFKINSSKAILEQFGLGDFPVVIVFNKIDLVDDEVYLHTLAEQYPGSIFVSSKTGKGIERLFELLRQKVQEWVA